MGLVCFSTATGSLIGPLAVSNQYHLRDIYYDMVFVFPRWVGSTTPMAPTARASLEAAHLGSLEPLFLLPLPLSCLPEKLKYIDHRSRIVSYQSLHMLLFYQFTFTQNRPKSDISEALGPIHYILYIKSFCNGIGGWDQV